MWEVLVPKYHAKERDIWTAEELFHAIDVCDDEKLKLCMNLAFACTLRVSEILGLTWDCVDVTEDAVSRNEAYITINKQIQRVSKKALEELGDKDVIRKFTPDHKHCSTILVLKTPKTQSSIRKVFLPRTVAGMLIEWKKKQDEYKELLGTEYEDNDLVICSDFGTPLEESSIKKAFNRLIEQNGLRKVVFHSLRHTSITYKLKLTGGDVKAVQGDSGHAQSSMVTEVYSHILDENRVKNAEEIEAAFYSGHTGKENKNLRPTDMDENMKTISDLLQHRELLDVIKKIVN